MSDEYLGVLLIGVERVAVEEEHGPERGVGGHVEEQPPPRAGLAIQPESAEMVSSQQGLWAVGQGQGNAPSKFQSMEKPAEITAPGHVESISSALTVSGS
ncbi:hypothetical protein J007_05136 [Cryptococcus neoformans]|nr:hypothetical protein J007_05136 [Cryptococcus neoformans var. grubii]